MAKQNQSGTISTSLSQEANLAEQIRTHKFDSRLSLAKLVASSPAGAERTLEAKGIIHQIAMQRVFDRFTKEQEAELLDVLWPLIQSNAEPNQQLTFGFGAMTNLAGDTPKP